MRCVGLAVLLAGLVVSAMPGGTTALAGGEAGKKPLPPILIAVESAAEDIVDLALAHDRGGVADTARQLNVSARAAIPALRTSGATARELAALRASAADLATASRRQGFIGLALAANAVSRLMPAFYARFATPVPATVLELDYLDREAELDSLAGRRRLVPPLVAELSRTWAGLRPRVIARGGDSEAAAFTAHVAAMKRLAKAGGGGALQREAANGLELVDRLEGVFNS